MSDIIHATWSPDGLPPALSLSPDRTMLHRAVPGAAALALATLPMVVGRYYWECVLGADTDVVGIARTEAPRSQMPGSNPDSHGRGGQAGAVIGLALDLERGRLWYSLDGIWDGNPWTGDAPAALVPPGPWWPCAGKTDPGPLDVRFDPAAWQHLPPTGFVALHAGSL